MAVHGILPFLLFFRFYKAKLTKTFHEIKVETNYHDVDPFLYWKHVELAKFRRFRCETLKPFFSKQAQDSYYHGILAATELSFLIYGI